LCRADARCPPSPRRLRRINWIPAFARMTREDIFAKERGVLIDELIFLGVGNKDRADDGVGPLMAEALALDEDLKKRGVFVSPHSGEGVSLMDVWRDAALVVIVDAMKSGQKAGTICRLDAAKDKLGAGVFRYSSHLFGLAEAVEMSRAMKRLPRKTIIFGIEGADFTFGEPMTPAVKKAFKKVISLVRQEFDGAGLDDA